MNIKEKRKKSRFIKNEFYCIDCSKKIKIKNYDKKYYYSTKEHKNSKCINCGLKYEIDVVCQEELEDIFYVRTWENGDKEYKPSQSDLAFNDDIKDEWQEYDEDEDYCEDDE